MSYLRQLVSKKKRRYQEDGFDLDLSYITPRMIAMGFPSDKLEGIYRNPKEEVYRFLEGRHKDHYMIYNLCSERSYDGSKFHNRVACFPFDDHNAPPLLMMEVFCKHVEDYLAEHPENTAVVHCKAGKGRTGVMISAWLLYSKQWKNADEALRFFAAARTEDQKGVTIPSQNRYVHYFDYILKNSLPPIRPYAITRIRFFTTPRYESQNAEPWFRIWSKGQKIYSDKPKMQLFSSEGSKRGDEIVDFNFEHPVVSGDVKIEVFDRDRFGNIKEELFHFWFNTGFVSPDTPLVLEKGHLDKAIKDKHHKKFRKEFKVEVAFEEAEEEQACLESDDDLDTGPADLSVFVQNMCEEVCSENPTYKTFKGAKTMESALEFAKSVVGKKSSSGRGGVLTGEDIQLLTKAIIECTDRISQFLHDMSIEGKEDARTIQVADDLNVHLKKWNAPPSLVTMQSTTGGSGSGVNSPKTGRRHSASTSSYLDYGVSLVTHHAQSVQNEMQNSLSMIINQLKVDNSFEAALGVAAVCHVIHNSLRDARRATAEAEKKEKAALRERQRTASMVNTAARPGPAALEAAAAEEAAAEKQHRDSDASSASLSKSPSGASPAAAAASPSSTGPISPTSATLAVSSSVSNASAGSSGSRPVSQDLAVSAENRLNSVRKAVHATADIIEVRFDSLRARIEAEGPAATRALAILVEKAIKELVACGPVDPPPNAPAFEIPSQKEISGNADIAALTRKQIDGGIAYLGRTLGRVCRRIDVATVNEALVLAKTVRTVLKMSEIDEEAV